MMNDADYLVLVKYETALLEAMQKHGGGFASALAVAWLRADMQNSEKLRHAFGDLLLTYRQFLSEKGES